MKNKSNIKSNVSLGKLNEAIAANKVHLYEHNIVMNNADGSRVYIRVITANNNEITNIETLLSIMVKGQSVGNGIIKDNDIYYPIIHINTAFNEIRGQYTKEGAIQYQTLTYILSDFIRQII